MKILATFFVLALGITTPAQRASIPARLQKGQALLNAKDYAGAAAEFEAVTVADPTRAQAWYLWAYSLHAGGEQDKAIPLYEKSAATPATRASSSYNLACIYAQKPSKTKALDWLEKALSAGFENRFLLQTDPDLEALRKDKRFLAMAPPIREGAECFVEPTRVLRTFVGEAPDDQFGWVARKVGDLDGDGVIDFATSSPTSTRGGPSAGSVYVYSSRTGKLLFRKDGAPGQTLGNGVGSAGDVNGDGTPDVIVGAPGYPRIAGRAYVYSGVGGAVLLDLTVGQVGDSFGLKVCGVGDLDGDGRAEVAVGANRASPQTRQGAGAVHVFGGTGELLFTIDGEAAGDSFGSAVDADLDPGHRRLIVGAMNAGQRGKVYVYELSAEGAEIAFTIDPIASSRNLGQYFVADVGDVDGDGVHDVYAADFNDNNSTGRVVVHSGANGKQLLELRGQRPGEGLGTSPSAAGDIDGDGCADLIVGAWQNGEHARSAGKCYLFSGRTGEQLGTITSREPHDTFGFDATGLGDVDGDGQIDYLVTSAWAPVKGPKTGRVFILAGTKPRR